MVETGPENVGDCGENPSGLPSGGVVIRVEFVDAVSGPSPVEDDLDRDGECWSCGLLVASESVRLSRCHCVMGEDFRHKQEGGGCDYNFERIELSWSLYVAERQ